MDADCKEKRREWGIQPPKKVERHERFSMDPQRFEEILAEITTGYSNIRSSFENVNISEILEEMVTEYAREALEAEGPPKFAELAVLLQHCAALYGRKVDYLYQNVVDVSEALAVAEPAPASPPEGAGAGAAGAGGAARRRRRASGAGAGAGEFAHVSLAPCAGATRAREAPRPPPTLPRMYIELEPRVPAPHEEPLRDAAGDPVGLPCDYHVTSRLYDGYLVEELEAAPAERSEALRPLSLVELQEAISAAAPPDPPPLPDLLSPGAPPSPEPPPPLSPEPLSPEPPPPLSTEPPPPLSTEPLPQPSLEELAPAALLARRKRTSVVNLADILDTPIKMFVTRELSALVGGRIEFSLPAAWVQPVVSGRARRLLERRAAVLPQPAEFRGFERHPDVGGFPGWSQAEVAAARAAGQHASKRALDLTAESDDDGFFDCASFTSFESRCSPPPPPAPAPAPPADAAWTARVAAAAAAEEARGGVDVRALGAAVLRALPPAGPLPFADLLRRAAADKKDVSRLLLATLFLANSGNVEISSAPPLSLGQFSVTLVSSDERLFAAAADAEAGLHAPPAPAPPAPALMPPPAPP